MADEVCDLVLHNNVVQNEALDVAEVQAPGMVDVHLRLLDWLSERAGLDRELEALPTDAEMARRLADGQGLTRPELAVLLAYSKNQVTADLLVSELPDEPWLERRLLAYFPEPVRSSYPGLIAGHPLRRQLIAMLVANDVVNHGGISMIHRLISETSASTADVARAHLVAWDIYDLGDLQSELEALGPAVSAQTRIAMEQEIKRLAERATRWLLRNEAQPLDSADGDREVPGPGSGPEPDRLRTGRQGPNSSRPGSTRHSLAGWRRSERPTDSSTSRWSQPGPGERSSTLQPSMRRSTPSSTCPGCGRGSPPCPEPITGSRWLEAPCVTTSSANTPSSPPRWCRGRSGPTTVRRPIWSRPG